MHTTGQALHSIYQPYPPPSVQCLEVVASARNVEMYAGQGDATAERTYLKTVRSASTSAPADSDSNGNGDIVAGAGFMFSIDASDLHGAGGGGAFRNIYLKFQTLRPAGSTQLQVSSLVIQVAEAPDPANVSCPVQRRSAAASGGAGGVAEVSADQLAGVLGALRGGGGGGGENTKPTAPLSGGMGLPAAIAMALGGGGGSGGGEGTGVGNSAPASPMKVRPPRPPLVVRPASR
jgi:hypothetical protein